MELIAWFLPFINLAVSAYIWGFHLTRTYDSKESFDFFYMFTIYIFGMLLASFPIHIFKLGKEWKPCLIAGAISIGIQCYLNSLFYSFAKMFFDSISGIFWIMFFITVAINIAGLLPMFSDLLLIPTLYLCNLMYTYKSAPISLISYSIPSILMAEAVVTSFGISQLKKSQKYKVESFQSTLGLNDSQLFFVLLIFFSFFTNLLDFFENSKHLLPLVVFPLVLIPMHTQFNGNYLIAKFSMLFVFLLHTSAYHAVKLLTFNKII